MLEQRVEALHTVAAQEQRGSQLAHGTVAVAWQERVAARVFQEALSDVGAASGRAAEASASGADVHWGTAGDALRDALGERGVAVGVAEGHRPVCADRDAVPPFHALPVRGEDGVDRPAALQIDVELFCVVIVGVAHQVAHRAVGPELDRVSMREPAARRSSTLAANSPQTSGRVLARSLINISL